MGIDQLICVQSEGEKIITIDADVVVGCGAFPWTTGGQCGFGEN